jgi:hypothetical protein
MKFKVKPCDHLSHMLPKMSVGCRTPNHLGAFWLVARGVLLGAGNARQCLCMDHADVDLDGYVPITYRMSIPARLTITATAKNWHRAVDTGIIDALLTLLPVDSVSTFIAHYAQLSKESGSAKRQGGPCLNRYTRFPSQSKHSRRC